MASPFAVFRRNQKLFLAIAGILAMIAFVFLDPVMRYLGGSRAQNPVVVQTKYGNLTESDLHGLVQQRQLVENFLRQATFETVNSLIEKGRIDARMQNFALEQSFNTWQQELMGRSTLSPEAAAVETFVLAKKAEQSGMLVSDRAINDMLKLITNDSLPGEVIAEIIARSQPGRRTSVGRLFEAIRTEMLASKLSQTFAQSLRDVPPAQRFEYYLRLNRRAKAEVMPLAVADFASQVADPPPAELQKFYDEYKDRYPDPNSPDPGFKQAKQVAFQYFKADFARFKDEIKPQITDEEISEYYDRNKSQFRAIELPDEKSDAEKSDAEKSDAEKAETEKPASTSESDERPASGTSDGKPVEEPAPATSEPQLESSRVNSRTVRLAGTASSPAVRLVSLQSPEQAENSAAPTGQAAEPEPAKQEESPDKPASENPDEPPTEQADVPPAEPRYEPLEKVADNIRDTLVAQKANKRISEIFEELSGEMRRYSDELDLYNSQKANNPSAAPPKLFPFVEMAQKHQLIARELPLVTAAEAANEDIGKVSRVVQDRRAQFGFRSEPFGEFAFSDSRVAYRPEAMEDGEGNQFLFWKTDEKAAFVPTLDAIRNQVVAAWKNIQARALAKKRAEEYAVQARVARKPLTELFADQTGLKPAETGYFSWLSTGNVPFDALSSQPRVSQVEGADRIGNAFMETVFALSQGDVGVAINHPQDTVYVVRLAEYQQPLDDLRTDFAREPATRYLPVAITDQRKVFEAWLSDLNRDAGIHWERPADTGSRRIASSDMPPMDEEF